MTQDSDDHHQALCAALGIDPDSSYPATKEAFIKKLRSIACAHISLHNLAGEQDNCEVAVFCNLFFDDCTSWHSDLSKGQQGIKDHSDAARLKTQAGAITRGMQNVIVQLARCEGLIYSVSQSLEEDIRQAQSQADDQNRDIKWTYDLPEQVALMTKKRNVLSDYMVKIRAATPIVEKLEFAFSALERGLDELLGAERARKVMDDYVGMLRKHQYRPANRFLKTTGQQDVKRLLCFDRKERKRKWAMIAEIADLIRLCIEKRARCLTGRGGRLFLRQWEIRLAYDTMSKELTNARSFLSKYEVPEIRYRRDALKRQQESLQRIVTLEDLIALYESLLRGRFFPMTTLKDVRAFEEGTLKKVEFTVQAVSGDLEKAEQAILKLSQGPDPESVPDDKLFETIDNMAAGAG